MRSRHHHARNASGGRQGSGREGCGGEAGVTGAAHQCHPSAEFVRYGCAGRRHVSQKSLGPRYRWAEQPRHRRAQRGGIDSQPHQSCRRHEHAPRDQTGAGGEGDRPAERMAHDHGRIGRHVSQGLGEPPAVSVHTVPARALAGAEAGLPRYVEDDQGCDPRQRLCEAQGDGRVHVRPGYQDDRRSPCPYPCTGLGPDHVRRAGRRLDLPSAVRDRPGGEGRHAPVPNPYVRGPAAVDRRRHGRIVGVSLLPRHRKARVG